MKIEWASSFRADGSRRRPPPSTMHGWLAKMRGTLIGDEALRSKGMKEMRDARALKKYNAERKKKKRQTRHSVKSGSMFSFLGLSQKKKKRPTFTRGNTGGSRHSTGHRSNRSQLKRPSARSRGSGSSSGPRAHRPSIRPHDSNVRRGSRH